MAFIEFRGDGAHGASTAPADAPEIERVEARPGWATQHDLARFGSGELTHDVILAKGASMAFDAEVPFGERRNANTLVVGGSGSGKSNLLQANLANHLPANIALTDSKGELFRTTAAGYEADGYEVLRLDTINLEQSCRFSPLSYVYTDEDVVTVGKMVMDGLSPDRRGAGRTVDPFWENSADLLMFALIGILLTLEREDGAFANGAQPTGPERRYLTFERLFTLLDLIKIGAEDGGDVTSPLDLMVEWVMVGGTLEGPDGSVWHLGPHPESCGVRHYHAFKTAAHKTLKSILISLYATVASVRTPQTMRVLSGDDLRLNEIDEGKRVLYFVMSDNDSSYSWLGNLAFKLLINRAMLKADANPDGRLKRPVMFMCDEFANLGRIPDFERAISIARSRRMGFMIFIQGLEQVNRVYGEAVCETIMDNCDATVFLGGGSGMRTARHASELCGERGTGSRLPLITAPEFSRLPRERCIVKISGERPLLAVKYDAHRHPNADRWLALSA